MGKTKQLIKFYTKDCAPCKIVTPIIEELEQKYPDIEFISVDATEDPYLAHKYNIRSVPALFYLRKNEIVDQSVGLVQKEQIEASLKNL